MSKVIIKFDQAGNIQAEALGFTGRACEDTTNKLFAGMHTKTQVSEKKPEYNQSATGQKVEQRW